MKTETNHLDQQVGYSVPNFETPALPRRQVIKGQYCRLEPLGPDQHAEQLWSANAIDAKGKAWTYLPYGPFENFNCYKSWLTDECMGEDPFFFAIVDLKNDEAVGVASYLRIKPDRGSIEVGHLHFSPLLQRTPASTEAMYLMMRTAFDLGYRRYEWKCNALNTPSKVSAQRLGFSFEGIFRQAAVVKGHNRDTAWFAIMDHEWSAVRQAMETWLRGNNFDAEGNQKISLSALTKPLLHQGIQEARESDSEHESR